MSVLIRYQLALLLRSQRWLPPVLLFVLLIVLGSFGGQQYGDSLGWCAAMLVPSCAWLTRTVLTGEPDPARACVAAASGPHRAHLAPLTAALAVNSLLALVGGAFEWLAGSPPVGVAHPPLAATAAHGALSLLVGLLTGTALGALCAPPVMQRPAAAVLTLTGASLVLLVAPVSPVNIAVRDVFTSGSPDAATTAPLLPLLAAAVLLALAWTAAVRAAARAAGRAAGE